MSRKVAARDIRVAASKRANKVIAATKVAAAVAADAVVADGIAMIAVDRNQKDSRAAVRFNYPL
jgi:hypothetical protein